MFAPSTPTLRTLVGGASPIFPTSMWWASVTASGSKAGGAVHGATIAWSRSWIASMPCTWISRWMSSSSAATDGCRPLDGVGGISRYRGAPSCSRRTDGRPAGKSRRQHRRSRQSGAARPAVQPGKRLRQMRALSAIAAVQGNRLRVVDHGSGGLGGRSPMPWPHTGRGLQHLLIPVRCGCRQASDSVWNDQFPMILPPDTEDGLGVAVLNSSAESHFSFTNALGLISAEQARRLSRRSGSFRRPNGSSPCTIICWNIPCRSWRSPSASEPLSSTAAGSCASSSRSGAVPSSCTAIAISTGSAPAVT